MRTKIGSRLLVAREDRKLSQTEMAELLGVSTSTYSRLERNETCVDWEQLANFSQKLQIPIQEFIPDVLSINNNNHQNGHYGLVMGNIYNYSDKELIKENEKLQLLLEAKEKEIGLLHDKIASLEELLAIYRKK